MKIKIMGEYVEVDNAIPLTNTLSLERFVHDNTQAILQVPHRIVVLFNSYPNKRVIHLALHAKKRRTRKKNMRRIGRELKRELKNG